MKKDNVIYVVTSGEYSEYGIEGVFRDPKKAVAYAKAKNGEVEIFKLKDDDLNISGDKDIVFKVDVIFTRALTNYGDYAYSYTVHVDEVRVEYETEVSGHITYNQLLHRGINEFYPRTYWYYELYLKNYDTALLNKIVQDEFAKWKAEQEGIT